MTPQTENQNNAEWLDALLSDLLRDPNLPYRERGQLAAAREILQPLLAPLPQLNIPQIAFQPITPPAEEWQPLGKYSYVSKSGMRELRIPYTDITAKELSYFTEAACDADAQIVRVRI